MEDGDSTAEADTTFAVYGFRISVPSHTVDSIITVQGSAVPDEDFTLTVKNLTETENQPKTYDSTVTEKGTFGIEVSLPMAEEDQNVVQKFEITLTMDGQEDVVRNVTYTHNYPYVNEQHTAGSHD